MEKIIRSRNKFLKFLPPRPAPAITFPTNPSSPKKDKKSHHLYKGFSGPIISTLPEDDRRKIHNSSYRGHEPTSPKVSCMGKIKNHKKKKKTTKVITNDKHPSLPRNFRPGNTNYEVKKKASGFGKLFGGARPQGRKSDDFKCKPSKLVVRSVPGLGQIKRLPSRRNSLADFDWTVHIAAVEGDHDGEYFSDEESEGDEKEVIIPFSAPIIMGGGGCGFALEPKKEINLWKRRTMTQPKPLRVN